MAYMIIEKTDKHEKAIKCLDCKAVSFNPNDIKHLYCGNCKKFHEKAMPLEMGEEKCREIGHLIGAQMPRGWGFALIMFSFGENGFSTFISNAQRKDMIKALRECADKIEGEKLI